MLERLNQLLSYCPESGEFRWLAGRRVGQRAGYLDTDGYRRIQLDRRRYLLHRLAWLITHGEWPTAEIDHIDGNRSNNQIKNLRSASRTENGRNRARMGNNLSGHPGVHFDTRRGKWCAQVRVNGKCINLGRFNTLEEAIAVRQAAEIKYFGEFRRAA